MTYDPSNRYGNLAELHEKIEVLEEENRYLKECLHPKNLPIYRGIHLTNKESILLNAIVTSHSICSKSHAMNRLYHPDEEPAEAKIVDVFINKLRNKLSTVDVHIQTIWGQGWRISEKDKAILSVLEETPMPDPFSTGHANDRAKVVKDEAAKEVIARDSRMRASAKARNAPKEPVSKGYAYPPPIWRQ